MSQFPTRRHILALSGGAIAIAIGSSSILSRSKKTSTSLKAYLQSNYKNIIQKLEADNSNTVHLIDGIMLSTEELDHILSSES